MRIKWMGVLGALCVGVFTGPVAAEEIVGYNPAINDRFLPGTFPNGSPPTPNPTFMLASADLSGIGWRPTVSAATQNVMMISDIHYVAATHFAIGVGNTLAFRAKDGSFVTRTVVSETQIAGSDVMVGQFDVNNPLPGGPGGVASYPIATGSLTQFNGQVGFFYGQRGRVGRNIISTFLPPNTVTSVDVGTGPTQVLTSDFDPNIQLDGLPQIDSETVVTIGDSGSPTFMILDGQVSMMGHHVAAFGTVATPLGSADAFLAAYQAQIAAQLALTGRVLALQPVPEPAVVLCIALPVAAAWAARRRKVA